MGKYFDSKEQAQTFREIAKSLINDGAVQVGLTGSRAEGKQHDEGHNGDVDIIATYIDPYYQKLDKLFLHDCNLPDGTQIPPKFEVHIAPYHAEGMGIVRSMKQKAIWWFKQEN